jgi:hypothetical protein
MTPAPQFPGKKISLYGKKIEMLPKISLFKPDKKNPLKAGVKFWPETEDQTDDELPESQ